MIIITQTKGMEIFMCDFKEVIGSKHPDFLLLGECSLALILHICSIYNKKGKQWNQNKLKLLYKLFIQIHSLCTERWAQNQNDVMLTCITFYVCVPFLLNT